MSEPLASLLARIETTEIVPAFLPQPFVIDWGTSMRGQGKRFGRGKNRMIMGGMSGAPRGKQTYHRMLPDAPEEVRIDVNGLEAWNLIVYQRARSAGLGHGAAICIAEMRGEPEVLVRALRDEGVDVVL